MNEIDSFFIGNVYTLRKFNNFHRVPIQEIIGSETRSTICSSKANTNANSESCCIVQPDKHMLSHSLQLKISRDEKSQQKILTPGIKQINCLDLCSVPSHHISFVNDERILNTIFDQEKQANYNDVLSLKKEINISRFKKKESAFHSSSSQTCPYPTSKPTEQKCKWNFSNLPSCNEGKENIDNCVFSKDKNTSFRRSERIKNMSIYQKKNVYSIVKTKIPASKTKPIIEMDKKFSAVAKEKVNSKKGIVLKREGSKSFHCIKNLHHSKEIRAQKDKIHSDVDTVCDLPTKQELGSTFFAKNAGTQEKTKRTSQVYKPISQEKNNLGSVSKMGKCTKMPKNKSQKCKRNNKRIDDDASEDNYTLAESSTYHIKPFLDEKSSDFSLAKKSHFKLGSNDTNTGKRGTLKYLKQRQSFLRDQICNEEQMDIFESFEKKNNQGLCKLFEVDLNESFAIKTPKDKDKFKGCFSCMTPRLTLLSELGDKLKTPSATFTPLQSSSKSEQKHATQLLYRHLKYKKQGRRGTKRSNRQCQLKISYPLKRFQQEFPVLPEGSPQNEDTSFDDYFNDSS